jgi:hypothetical protein
MFDVAIDQMKEAKMVMYAFAYVRNGLQSAWQKDAKQSSSWYVWAIVLRSDHNKVIKSM